MNAFRPWGLLHWVLEKLPSVKWSLLGSIWTEERATTAWQILKENALLQNAHFVHIKDPASRFSPRIAEKIRQRRAEFLTIGGNASDIQELNLFERAFQIEKLLRAFVTNAGPNVIFDISCFPKRYFFPLAKLLLRERAIKNLIFVYTLPASHTSELAENFQTWNTLPFFQGKYPEPPTEMLIVSVGYLAMGLPEQIEQDNPTLSVKVFFPFPPGPPSFQKTLELVRKISKNVRRDRMEVVRVDAIDMPDAYDHIVACTNGGRRAAVFAPYGPKPISLAMAVYATLHDRPVFYNQPTTYHPDYSIGVMRIDGIAQTFAYCMRLNGVEFYTKEQP